MTGEYADSPECADAMERAERDHVEMKRTDDKTLIAKLRTLARGGSIAVEAADRLEELTTWRPIAGAPSNERVLLLCEHEQYAIGQQTTLGWFIDGHVLPVIPTYWLPLPDAPTEAQ